jgi:hypothetical protein
VGAVRGAFDGCFALAVYSGEASRLELGERSKVLAEWYAPLFGPQIGDPADVVPGRAALFVFGGGGGDRGAWGGETELRPEELLRASEDMLRSRIRFGAFVASDGAARARLVAGTGPTALYKAASLDGAIAVWATHATAAAYLARAEVELCAEHVTELFAIGYVGLADTHLRGVSACPPATVVDIAPSGVVERSFWPAPARYEALAERDALAQAEGFMLAHLERVPSADAVWLGLTAGKDSRALAAGFRALGRSISTFTWSFDGGPEATGAEHVARALDLPHRTIVPRTLEDHETLGALAAEVRWSEGLMRAPLLFVPRWPEEVSRFVAGNAGEVGRAHTYGGRVAEFRAEPHAGALARQLRADEAIRAAHPDARRFVRARAEKMVAHAEAHGLRGWRILDGVYYEQRQQRFVRALGNRTTGAVVVPFLDPDVGRALISMPLGQRMEGALHRRLVARVAPSLVPAPDVSIRRGVPIPLRRVASEIRRRRARSHPPPFPFPIDWKTRPTLERWLGEEVFDDPVLRAALGGRWLASTRAGFLAGEEPATLHALQAAALSMYRSELAGLRWR